MQSLWVYNDVAVPDSPTSRSEHDPLSLESPGSSFDSDNISDFDNSSTREPKAIYTAGNGEEIESDSDHRHGDEDQETDLSSTNWSIDESKSENEYLEDEDVNEDSHDTEDNDYPEKNALSPVKEQQKTSGEYARGLTTPQGDEVPERIPVVKDAQRTAAERLYAKVLGTIQNEFYNKITISDDQSAGSKIEERNLLALRGRDYAEEVRNFLPPQIQHIGSGSNQPAAQGNHALQDYQVQLILLEQQNKKKLVMARQEQERIGTFAGNFRATSMEAGAPTSSGVSPTTDRSSRIDSRGVEADLQNVLNGADASQLDLQKLQEYIELLQTKAQYVEAIRNEQAPSRYQIFYRILQRQSMKPRKGLVQPKNQYISPFFDHPEWVQGQGNENRIQCNLPLHNFDLYLEKNKDVAFIVYRNFDPESTNIIAKEGTVDGTGGRAVHLPKHTSETIRPINKDLDGALRTLLGSKEEYAELFNEYVASYELSAPYLFIYHSRASLEGLLSGLSLPARTQLSLLSDYVTEMYRDEYAAADSLLLRNKISPEGVPYLFKPGDLLVSRVDGQYLGCVATSWPKIHWKKRVPRMRASTSKNGTSLPSCGPQDAMTRAVTDKVTIHGCEVKVWRWAFDGNFQREYETIQVEIPIVENEDKNAPGPKGKSSQRVEDKEHKYNPEENDISDLNVFPLQYAPANIVEECRRRGKTFWKCRNRRLVSYRETETESIQNLTDERYMIDLKTYRSVHPDNLRYQSQFKDEVGPGSMARDEPPDEQFELLLPLKIKGYNLRRKKWFDLWANRIFDVTWNKEAFKSLVIDGKARDLIRALVSNQLAAEKGTDLIMGKGNGLILLLHGGPGTGKTLTAESVAEIAEKPLYRVTCGDVGTKAEDVEKYLESVLHLGKIWGCVVLLDEADVFLEQRSLDDMERNALVSVFLRVLEYYEGILVLTSNRVGTFDEAFKSRIQLALHYPVLGEYQRLRIWENFIKRLESFGEDKKVDIADLRDHLGDLKEEKMNGRQIRNAITTARQYAEWKGQTLTYEHMRDVIEVSGRFDKYLDKLNGGFTQDELAQDEGFRLA